MYLRGRFRFQSTWPRRCNRPAVFVAALLMAFCGLATACNIPVFRYALERWEPDNYQLVIYHQGELTAAQLEQIDAWRQQSLIRGGACNFEVQTAQLGSAWDDDLQSLWKSADLESKFTAGSICCFRSAPIRGDRKIIWTGALAEFHPQPCFESPLRTELLDRLLAGDSGVWIVVPGTDPEATTELANLLENELGRLGDELPFPAGIDEPGSELYSEVPLTIRFSVLQLNTARDAEFLKLIKAIVPHTILDGKPLAIPVFGRARALEVFSSETVTVELIEELSAFMTGACSCQVKQANPGFDLPMSADWRPLLFANLLPPEEAHKEIGTQAVEYVPIPAGTLAADDSPSPEEELTEANADTAEDAKESADAQRHSGELEIDSAADMVPPPPEDLPAPQTQPEQAAPVIADKPFPLLQWVGLGVLAVGAVLMLAVFWQK